ncbi:hypothetical protein G9409_03525 [Chlorobium sp. BLA1]|uniref:hypothetical protein n=1 Tax=Candidatus Chlorobium masyuteum TaxID=2716876 RepID=UPI00142387DD|nr:hypothetical protein [Candidatus Chlorobium masyuteum]NHQ59665.1 hypothetical protein [Candidatus Chlorobium masyuteum]
MTKGNQFLPDGEPPQKGSNNSEPNHEGLTPSDVFISFLTALGILVGTSSWMIIQNQTIIPIILCVIISGFLLICSWPCAKNGWLGGYGRFGNRLWSFPSLWYVVFLVGTYFAVLTAINQSIQSNSNSLDSGAEKSPAKSAITQLVGINKISSGGTVDTSAAKSTINQRGQNNKNLTSIRWETVTPKLAQDILQAAFLAVITSVLAQAFSNVGDLTRNLNLVIARTENANTDVTHTSDTVSTMSKKITKHFSKVEVISRSIYTSITATLAAARVQALILAANDIRQKYEPVGDAIERMYKALEKYHIVALHPFLPPGTTPPQDKKTNDPVIEYAERIKKSNPNDLPHPAYMATAIGRYFEAEAMERHFPGVLLHMTSFVYYTRTIQAIVKALNPWPDRYEFYTLMPKSPLELFRFGNSTDIKEWREFLKGYHEFQNERVENKKGVWRRYFAYSKNPTHPKGFITPREIKKIFDMGYVLTEKDGWLPRIVNSEDEYNQYFPSGPEGKEIQKDFLKGIDLSLGATLAGRSVAQLPEDKGWCKLKDVLLTYHGLKIDTSPEDPKINQRFSFRCMDDCEKDCVDNKIVIESHPYKRNSEGNNRSKRSFDFPTDFFAIRDLQTSEGTQWIFLIGLDQGSSTLQKTDANLAFAPVLDLVSMAAASSGSTNNNSASEIRKVLDKIFISPPTDHILKYHDILTFSEDSK